MQQNVKNLIDNKGNNDWESVINTLWLIHASKIRPLAMALNIQKKILLCMAFTFACKEFNVNIVVSTENTHIQESKYKMNRLS